MCAAGDEANVSLDAVLALVAQRAKIAGLYGIDPPVKAKSPFLHDRVAVIGVLAGGHLAIPTASSRLKRQKPQVLRSEDARIKKIEHFRNSAHGNSSEGWR